MERPPLAPGWVLWFYVAVIATILLGASFLWAYAAGDLLYSQPLGDFYTNELYARWFSEYGPDSNFPSSWKTFRAETTGILEEADVFFSTFGYGFFSVTTYLEIGTSNSDCTAKSAPTDTASSTTKTWNYVPSLDFAQTYSWSPASFFITKGTCYQIRGRKNNVLGQDADVKPHVHTSVFEDGGQYKYDSAFIAAFDIRLALRGQTNAITITSPISGQAFSVNTFAISATTTNLTADDLPVSFTFTASTTPPAATYTFSAGRAPPGANKANSSSTATLPNGFYNVGAVMDIPQGAFLILAAFDTASAIEIAGDASVQIEPGGVGGFDPTSTSSYPFVSADFGFFGNMLRDLVRFLFYPQPTTLWSFRELQNDLANKPPFAYWTAAKEGIELLTSGTSTIASADLSAIASTAPILGTFKTAFGWLLWAMFLFWLVRRFANYDF